MSMSGIEVDPEIPTLFNDIKLRATHKWATFKLSDDKKQIVVDEIGEPNKTDCKEDDKAAFEELKSNLQPKEPRYILYDFGFKNKENRLIKKIAFLFWCDDNAAPIKLKMLYASSKDTIKKSFTGIGLEFQANDLGDFDYDAFSELVERKA